MTPDIYPFSLKPSDNGHFVTSDDLAKSLWLGRPKDHHPKVAYYALGLKVHGPDNVTVEVYDMLSPVYGGVGELSRKYKPELGPAALQALQVLIIREQTLHAAEEFKRREAQRRAAEIEAIRQELFGEPT